MSIIVRSTHYTQQRYSGAHGEQGGSWEEGVELEGGFRGMSRLTISKLLSVRIAAIKHQIVHIPLCECVCINLQVILTSQVFSTCLRAEISIHTPLQTLNVYLLKKRKVPLGI